MMPPSPTIKLGIHEVIVSDRDEPCAVCATACHFIEICFEAFFCSPECINQMEHDYWLAVYDAIPEPWEEVSYGPFVQSDQRR